ncbi:MAG: hypothetical protein ISQ34_03755 [Rickettsiales bacterium]|nr:hypothetical protein [Rickettsiales bacterium]
MIRYARNTLLMPSSMKKLLMFVSLLLVLSLTSACVTKALWGKKSYQERISQFYVGSDSRYIVLVGPNYHYVLTDVGGSFKTILSLRQKNVLTISDKDSYVELDSNNGLQGVITFSGPFSVLAPVDKYKLQSYGINPDENDDVQVKIRVQGRRYVAKYLGPQNPGAATSQTLRIYYSDSNLVKGVGKAAITPIAVTLDAALLIGKVVVAPFKNY